VLLTVWGVDLARYGRLCEFLFFLLAWVVLMLGIAHIPRYRRCYSLCCIPSDRYYHVGGRVWFAGYHLHYQARVYARRLDGRLYRFVSFRFK
jgi:hypothetical protein